MKTLIITISRGSLIRNFFRMGVIKRILDAGWRVVVLSPQYQEKNVFAEFAHPQLFLEPLLDAKNMRFRKIIDEFCKGAIYNKTVNILFHHRLLGAEPNKLFYIPRLLFIAPLRFVPGLKRFLRWLDGVLNPQTEHDYLFEKYHPDVVFVTSAGGSPDAGVIKSAQRFKVKTFAMPKSWDNLSKILFNTKADKMIVWSPFMKEQTLKYQDYKEEDVIMTGAPQFDYYSHKEYLVSREEFCQKFGFDPNKKIILYGSAGSDSLVNEAAYVDLIHEFVVSGKLEPVQVLIRPHLGYINSTERFSYLEKYSGFILDRTDEQNHVFKDHWDPTERHLQNLFNSLVHSSVCINAASTLTIDATACGTPVININFDIEDNVSLNNSIQRFYGTDYIQAVTNVGATWVVKNKEEFLQALKDILERQEKRTEKMDELISYQMYKNDGHAAERIANVILG